MTLRNIISDFIRWLFSEAGSHVIYNLGLAVGAFLGGFAGLKIVSDWLENSRKERKIKRLKKKYRPEDNDDKGWETVFDPNRPGVIYVLDHRDLSRRWVANWDTFQDLGLPLPDKQNDERKTKLFEEYKKKDHILTQGRAER